MPDYNISNPQQVNIPALNDSQYIGMCVYNVAVLSILGVVLLFALGQQVELQYALVSAFIIFATTIVQLTIFIPKVGSCLFHNYSCLLVCLLSDCTVQKVNIWGAFKVRL